MEEEVVDKKTEKCDCCDGVGSHGDCQAQCEACEGTGEIEKEE
jgi:DnaJ-class molecular chaperone